jgi:hemolysin activation/secretion protein
MDGDSTQKPNTPVLCSAGCGFFGNPLTSNMCSKCHRDAQARQQQQQPQQTQPIENKPEPVKPSVVDQATASVPAVEQPQEEEQEQNDRRPQADTTRCFSCNKKVGLLGFRCRCDYVFCSMHRYVSDHSF